MQNRIFLFSLLTIFLGAVSAIPEERKFLEYEGVVTLHLIPVKVVKINKIIEDSKPATSYIGDKGIMVRLEDNPNVMANWTVVKIKCFKYPAPETIDYEVLSEKIHIAVNYHAVEVEIKGYLSAYTQQ